MSLVDGQGSKGRLCQTSNLYDMESIGKRKAPSSCTHVDNGAWSETRSIHSARNAFLTRQHKLSGGFSYGFEYIWAYLPGSHRRKL